VNARLNALGQPVGPPLDVTLPRPLPPRTAMNGRVASLPPLDPAAHAACLHEAFGEDADGRMWTYLGVGPFASAAAFRAWLDAQAARSDPLVHTIVVADRPVGLASFMRIDPDNGGLEIGQLAFAPALKRTKAATEAIALMMTRAFDELGYRRCEWKCDALNAPSRSAADRLGFRYEGTFRKATHYKGRSRDTAWFSVVDDEWPALRAAFAAWLAPDNFTADGRQIRPLAARTAPRPQRPS
jgi:RimJ/RimL family protein N-acetyltransferase